MSLQRLVHQFFIEMYRYLGNQLLKFLGPPFCLYILWGFVGTPGSMLKILKNIIIIPLASTMPGICCKKAAQADWKGKQMIV